jgi:hypothetical protein
LDWYTHCLGADGLSGRRKETFVLLDACALLKTQFNFLGTAHPFVEVLWVVHERDKLVDAAADTLLVEQDEHFVAKSRAAGNETEQLVECRDAGIGSGLGQLAQLFLCMFLGRHSDEELLEAFFELCEVLGTVGAIEAVSVIKRQARPGAVRRILGVVLAVLSRVEVNDQLAAKLSGVLDKVQGKDVNVVLAPWAKQGKVPRDGVEPPDVLLRLPLASKLDRL